VAAGVIGLIAAVTVDIIATGIVDVVTALLAVGGFLVLNRWHGKLTVLYIVLGLWGDRCCPAAQRRRLRTRTCLVRLTVVSSR
jgi:hypothetical protein